MNERFDSGGTPARWRQAFRVDVGRLAKATKTAVGVRVEGVVARAGILEYQRADGTTVRELLPPEEAGRLDSLASLRDAPVTVSHPGGGTRMVTPETFRQDAVGHVSGEPRFDGTRVIADLAIQEQSAIERIDAGQLVELSAGYRVMIDPTPGEWRGQRYDQVQRNREYNHTALLPRGMARAGAEASLRLDGVESGADVAVMRERTDDDDRAPTRAPGRAREPELRIDSMKTERIDGIEYEIGTTAWAQARARWDAKVAADAAALEKRAADAEAALAKQTARADAAEARVKTLEADNAPARIDARIAERTALVEKVRPVLGAETKLDGKSDVDVMTLALAKLAPDFRADSIPEAQREVYIRARFDAEIGNAAKRSPLEQSRVDAMGAPPKPGAPTPAPYFPRISDKWRGRS